MESFTNFYGMLILLRSKSPLVPGISLIHPWNKAHKISEDGFDVFCLDRVIRIHGAVAPGSWDALIAAYRLTDVASRDLVELYDRFEFEARNIGADGFVIPGKIEVALPSLAGQWLSRHPIIRRRLLELFEQRKAFFEAGGTEWST